MAYDLEEQESIDQLKAWWDKWGTALTAVVCVICLAFAGWNVWNWWQRNQVAKASAVYVALQTAVEQGDKKSIGSTSLGLIDEYSSTVYAPLGALNAAAAQARLGDTDAATNLLNWVINQKSHPEYADIARVRLAAVLLSAGKAADALKALEAVKPVKALEIELNDRFGDVYFALGDFAKAKESWGKVLATTDPMDNNLRTLVNLKMGAIPVTK